MERRGLLLVLVATLLVLSSPAGLAQEPVVADIAPTATLLEAGQAVALEVTVICPKKSDVLEAFVYVTQEGNTSRFAPIADVKCKGRPETYAVRVPAVSTPFHTGEATATSYVLVQDREGQTASGGESQPITIS
jgi:hypothetical protein